MNLMLPAEMYSSDQISVCIQELRRLVSLRRDMATQSRVGVASRAQASVPTLVEALLHANGLTGATLKELEDVIKALESLRSSTPVVHLTFASLPGPKLIAKLVEWFRREVHPQALLSFVMDRTIGGGVIIRTHATMYDFSFTNQLLRQKDRLTEIVARV
jgi:hypothetical protein